MKTNPLIKYPANVRVYLVRETTINQPQLKDKAMVEHLVGAYLRSLDKESVFAIYLDSQNKVLGIEEVTRGTLNMSLINPRDLVKSALLIAAAGIIVVHNHPSGSTQPSHEDRDITRRIQSACELFAIQLLDHIIIGDGSFSILHD